MTIGKRLRFERLRLGYNQTNFGAIGNVTRLAQHLYEKGERFPNAAFLAEVAKTGADIQSIVTGSHRSVLGESESWLIDAYRKAPDVIQVAILSALHAAIEHDGMS